MNVKYRSFKKKPKKAEYYFGYNQIKDYLEFWNSGYLVIVQNHKPYICVIPLAEIKDKHLIGRFRINGNVVEKWDFTDIQKGVEYLFPSVNEEILKKAVSMTNMKLIE